VRTDLKKKIIRSSNKYNCYINHALKYFDVVTNKVPVIRAPDFRRFSLGFCKHSSALYHGFRETGTFKRFLK